MQAMGRIFEVRKHTMFARWNRMAKQFARIAKDITMAVKAGGTDPASNPVLRRTIQNARAVNMPKDRIEAAVKRAAGRDAATNQQVLYEGYAPHGEPQLVIRCAFADFGRLQEALEARGLAPLSAEHEYLCTVPTELPENQATEVLTVIDRLEQEDDVQHVFHTLA